MKAAIILFMLVLLPSSFFDTKTQVNALISPKSSPHSLKQSYLVLVSEKPRDLSYEAYDIKILTSVLGSEKAAKEALMYSYRAISGFAARLTPEQVVRLKKQHEVLGVLVLDEGDIQMVMILGVPILPLKIWVYRFSIMILKDLDI